MIFFLPFLQLNWSDRRILVFVFSFVIVWFSSIRFGSMGWETMHLTCFCTTIFQKTKACIETKPCTLESRWNWLNRYTWKKQPHTPLKSRKKRNHCMPSYCFIFLGPLAHASLSQVPVRLLAAYTLCSLARSPSLFFISISAYTFSVCDAAIRMAQR